MNFQSALSDLCCGQSDIVELTRKHRLNSEQIKALEAVSRRVSGSIGTLTFPSCAISVN